MQIGTADYFVNVMTKFIVNERTYARKTDVIFFYNNKFSALGHSFIA